MSQNRARISPRNLSAQLAYRGRGNPPVSHPYSTISNCFPGLEFDFRAIWRRIFVGIVLSEHNNLVVAAEDSKLEDLCGCRLLRIEGQPTAVLTQGQVIPGRPPETLTSAANPAAVAFMEWGNTLALIWARQGQQVACEFTCAPSAVEVLPGDSKVETRLVRLEVRRIFAPAAVGPDSTAALTEALAGPGELTQGLCSPWQNDYRECACYYWAASRPDYVNVVAADDGTSRGDNWMQRDRTGSYLPDNRDGVQNLSYDDLFKEWERVLRFVIRGNIEPEVER